ncbi:unnamed protein product, partial [marine sediment metagenome]
TNYYNGVKARYLAEAGIQEAIARLREHVKSSAFDYEGEEWCAGATDAEWISESAPVYTVTSNIATNETATVEIVDEQRKININNASQQLLRWLLYNVSRHVCGDDPGNYGELPGNAIPDAQEISNNSPYETIEQLKQLDVFQENELFYDSFKEYVTVDSYRDRNSSYRSPVNINTAELWTLRSLFRYDYDDDDYDMIQWRINDLSEAIYDRVHDGGNPFTTWSDFKSFIDTYDGGVSLFDNDVVEGVNSNFN